MRSIAVGSGKPIRLSLEQRSRLKEFLQLKHKKATDSRFGVESTWRTCIRMYQGTPDDHQRWMPFENAPTVEVTIGAMACDSVYAQACDLIFQTKPPLTIRSRKDEFDKSAEAVQDLVNYGVESGVWNFGPAAKEALLDMVQLGTAVLYVPWTKTVRKTDIREVMTFGPKMYCLAPEDFILPANATKDVQSAPFCTMRMVMDSKDLNLQARLNSWTVDDAGTADTESRVRGDRMRAAGISGGGPDTKPPSQIGVTSAYFDIDDDGINEDIEVIWNMTSGGILKCMYNRTDCRPFILECYQDRAHTWAGLGVMEMSIPFERVETEIWNNHVWNMMISNTKAITGPSTALQEKAQIYPGMFIPNDDGEIKPLDMGEVNSTAVNAVGLVRAMANERVGTQNLSSPIRSSSRTPGISMLSMMQQANRRFTPAFDNMRNLLAMGVAQCLYRIQEQVRADNKDVMKKLGDILGVGKASLVIELFQSNEVELLDAIDIQLTAASVSVNRESDRQNMVMLATQIYKPYMDGMAQLAQIAAQPPFPGADRVAKEAAGALNKLMRKIIKTFDQISDVDGFLIELDQIQPMMEQLGMGGPQNPAQQMVGQLPQNGAGPTQGTPLQ